MLETRTLRLYDRHLGALPVPRIPSTDREFWTARKASQTARTYRATPLAAKLSNYSATYSRWTSRTDISGVSVMRACVRIYKSHILSFFIYPSSHHIKPETPCPRCPPIENIDKNTNLHVHLSVLFFQVTVLAVLHLKYHSTFSLIVASPKGAIGKNLQFPVIRIYLAQTSPSSIRPLPPVKGPYNNQLSPRAGATPIVNQSNGLKVWVNAVNGVNAWRSGVNAHG